MWDLGGSKNPKVIVWESPNNSAQWFPQGVSKRLGAEFWESTFRLKTKTFSNKWSLTGELGGLET
jgi:hypothetical protein